MGEVKFHVSVEEGNLLLEGLGAMPFARVFNLVTKLQRQASEQLDEAGMTHSHTEEPETTVGTETTARTSVPTNGTELTEASFSAVDDKECGEASDG